MWKCFIREINFQVWIFHFTCETRFEYQHLTSEILNLIISHMNSIFYMWKCSDFKYKMKISHLKVFQFHKYLTCKITYEISFRVYTVTIGTLRNHDSETHHTVKRVVACTAARNNIKLFYGLNFAGQFVDQKRTHWESKGFQYYPGWCIHCKCFKENLFERFKAMLRFCTV